MDDEARGRREAWRAQFRADLRRPRMWLIAVSLAAAFYVITYILVFIVTSVLDFVVPYLPWIQKPYVNPDPAPLIVAFRCANLIPVSMLLLCSFSYFFGDRNKMLKPRKTYRADELNADTTPRRLS